jgi:ATP phosphoribosyltransferase regulatory subunit
MPGKSSTNRTGLAAQNQRLMAVFEAAGHEYIEPEIIQPADVFLERAGEDLRSRTYVFSDPEGVELCLRPDLTVPTCRYHLARTAEPARQARYCYNGPAFRHHKGENHPREFDQLGLEWFGAGDAGQAEAEIFNLTIAAMEAAGLKNYSVRLGDLGLFHALLSAMDMPERWARRLAHEFWRPRAFHVLLRHLTGEQPQAASSLTGLVEKLAADEKLTAGDLVESVLDENNWQLVPGRSLDEIAGRLEEKAADKNSAPLDRASADLINKYLNVHGALEAVGSRLGDIAEASGAAFEKAVADLSARHKLFDLSAIKNGHVGFAAEFGRSLEYYTGFVFQIEVTDGNGAPVVIAGGGRYDDMISDIGKCPPVPAVGCAIYAERLLDATRGQGQ